MLSLKKVYRDELLQLALILSLLRGNSGPSYLENDLFGNGLNYDFDNGTSWRSLSPTVVLRTHFVHPKSLDSVLLNYERELFADLNLLGRYNRDSYRHPDVTAYLLNIERSGAPLVTQDVPSSDIITSSSSLSPQVQSNEQNSMSGPSDEESSNAGSEAAVAAVTAVGLELTQEDMDLIEVLWKQDIDLGFSLDVATGKVPDKPHSGGENISGGGEEIQSQDNSNIISPETTSISIIDEQHQDDLEKLKTLKAINNEDNSKDDTENELADPWAGLNYTIDTETGEYVIKPEELSETLTGADCGPSCDLPLGDLSLPLPEFLLDEALRLVDLEDSVQEVINVKDLENLSEESGTELSSPSPPPSSASEASTSLNQHQEREKDIPSADLLKDTSASEEELDFLSNMIQTSQFHHPHHRAAFQSRMPFVRTVSMEQRWQDLANLLSLPTPGDAAAAAAAAAAASGMPHPFAAAGHHHHHHHHHHLHNSLHNYSHPHSHGMGGYNPEATRGVLLHNATLAPPMGDLNGTSVPYSNIGGGGSGTTNLGNAVATSMNLTNSSEPMGEPNTTPHYKLEPSSHDMMYYQNSTSELNQTDGFLSSILNDEDLQLMDMAMNEGMYTMRMLDSNSSTISSSNLSIGASSAPSAAAAATTMSRTDVERMDTSSDSAVSSMGSERVPSLSDGEWCDAGSDSGHHTPGQHYVTDYQTKYRPYDYSSYSTSRQHAASAAAAIGGATDASAGRMPPVAQKKHQMFGKRYLQEQGATNPVHGSHQHHQQPAAPVKYEYRDQTANVAGAATSTATVSYNSTSGPQPEGAVGGPKPPEMKYSCSMEFGRHNHIVRNSLDHIQHNHTYHLPAESTGALQRPVSRDKSKNRKGGGGCTEEEHLTRDEKRARALNVPITVDDIINLPMDEFNERLSKYDLSEAQLSLIRDIRRRGKNKVAAQNCRKRKLDQILSLADEVKDMRDRKLRLVNEHDFVTGELQRIKDKYQQLYRHVFQNLRDPEGNQYSPYQYSLQTSADGSILVVPRSSSSATAPERKDSSSAQGRKE